MPRRARITVAEVPHHVVQPRRVRLRTITKQLVRVDICSSCHS